MTFKQLRQAINTPYFTTAQLTKLFSKESVESRNMQLKRFVDRHELTRLKRGVFIFAEQELDEFSLANILNPQSYVSLESMLNAYGLMPDIPAQVTSVTPLTSKTFTTPKGTFLYSKIDPRLYFGFQIENTQNILPYRVAEPEKAVLDYIYVRKVKDLKENRLDLSSLNKKRLTQLAVPFPEWVKEVIA